MQTMFDKILHFENEQFNIEALNQANNVYYIVILIYMIEL